MVLDMWLIISCPRHLTISMFSSTDPLPTLCTVSFCPITIQPYWPSPYRALDPLPQETPLASQWLHSAFRSLLLQSKTQFQIATNTLPRNQPTSAPSPSTFNISLLDFFASRRIANTRARRALMQNTTATTEKTQRDQMSAGCAKV